MRLKPRPPALRCAPVDDADVHTRPHRRVVVGRWVLRALHAAIAVARSFHARHRQWRRARDAFAALAQLDDHTLRDLGIHRSEIGSLTTTATGATSVRVHRNLSNVDAPLPRVDAHGVPPRHAPLRPPVALAFPRRVVRQPHNATT